MREPDHHHSRNCFLQLNHHHHHAPSYNIEEQLQQQLNSSMTAKKGRHGKLTLSERIAAYAIENPERIAALQQKRSGSMTARHHGKLTLSERVATYAIENPERIAAFQQKRSAAKLFASDRTVSCDSDGSTESFGAASTLSSECEGPKKVMFSTTAQIRRCKYSYPPDFFYSRSDFHR